MIEEIDFTAEHHKADMSKVDRAIINGKVYLAADRVLKIIDSKRGAFRDGSFRDSSITYMQGWTRSNDAIKKAVSKLKEGEQE